MLTFLLRSKSFCTSVRPSVLLRSWTTTFLCLLYLPMECLPGCICYGILRDSLAVSGGIDPVVRYVFMVCLPSSSLCWCTTVLLYSDNLHRRLKNSNTLPKEGQTAGDAVAVLCQCTNEGDRERGCLRRFSCVSSCTHTLP